MFHIDNRSRVPIHQQLQAQIVRYVSLGLLLPDQQLPSVRAMAQQLGINPNTVQKAYAALEMNGVLYTVAGRGALFRRRRISCPSLRSWRQIVLPQRYRQRQTPA